MMGYLSIRIRPLRFMQKCHSRAKPKSQKVNMGPQSPDNNNKKIHTAGDSSVQWIQFGDKRSVFVAIHQIFRFSSRHGIHVYCFIELLGRWVQEIFVKLLDLRLSRT